MAAGGAGEAGARGERAGVMSSWWFGEETNWHALVRWFAEARLLQLQRQEIESGLSDGEEAELECLEQNAQARDPEQARVQPAPEPQPRRRSRGGPLLRRQPR